MFQLMVASAQPVKVLEVQVFKCLTEKWLLRDSFYSLGELFSSTLMCRPVRVFNVIEF